MRTIYIMLNWLQVNMNTLGGLKVLLIASFSLLPLIFNSPTNNYIQLARLLA